jgi:hypothetical protein
MVHRPFVDRSTAAKTAIEAAVPGVTVATAPTPVAWTKHGTFDVVNAATGAVYHSFHGNGDAYFDDEPAAQQRCIDRIKKDFA